VPIVMAATGYTSSSGMNYILLFPEALYLPNLEHSLFNPNQLRHFGTIVQDNPYNTEPMSITTRDGTFTACLQSKGTNIYLRTWAPTQLLDLEWYPHITLCSRHPWNPREIKFPSISSLEQEEIEVRNVRALAIDQQEWGHNQAREEDILFGISQFRDRVISSARITHVDMEHRLQKVHINAIMVQDLPPIIPGPLQE
jgi:hypothetical protein